MINQDIQSRVDAFRGNPDVLAQRYQQNQQLIDLLALQKIKSEKEAAARQMQMQMAQQQAKQGQPPTVAEQREQEVLDLTKNEVQQQQNSLRAQQQQQQQAAMQKLLSGIAAAPGAMSAAQPQAMAAGGIVAFQEGGDVSAAEERLRQAQIALRRFGVVQRARDPEGYKTAQQEVQSAREALKTEKIRRLQEQEVEGTAPVPMRRLPGIRGLLPAAAPAAAPATGIGTPPIKFSDDPSEYLNAIQKLSPTGPVFDPFAAETRAIGAKSVAAAQEQEALRKKQMDELGIAGLKEEERYKKREEKLGKQEGELSGLSMLKAGLAIMSGESPHALVNIGKGAAVGAEDYIKGREKINNARERLDDAYSRLEQARRGETILNQRELAQLSKDVRTAEIQSEKDVVAGARQAYGLARDDAKAAASAYFTAKAEQAKIQSMEGIAGLDRASREKIEGMRIQAQKNIANMLPGEARVAMLLGKGETEKDRLESGLEKLDRLKGNLTEAKIAELYVKHVADQKKALQEPMSPTEFAKVLRSAMFSLKPEVADVDKTRPR